MLWASAMRFVPITVPARTSWNLRGKAVSELGVPCPMDVSGKEFSPAARAAAYRTEVDGRFLSASSADMPRPPAGTSNSLGSSVDVGASASSRAPVPTGGADPEVQRLLSNMIAQQSLLVDRMSSLEARGGGPPRSASGERRPAAASNVSFGVPATPTGTSATRTAGATLLGLAAWTAGPRGLSPRYPSVVATAAALFISPPGNDVNGSSRYLDEPDPTNAVAPPLISKAAQRRPARRQQRSEQSGF